MKVLTVAQMTEVDRLSTEHYGIPGILLMENAGIQCFRALEEEFSNDLRDLRIVTVCGKGNNGGDGMVLARQLFQRGIPVEVFLLGKRNDLRGDAAVNAAILHNSGQVIQEVGADQDWDTFAASLGRADVVIDALFGTGLSKPIAGIHARAVEVINQSSAFCLAVDIPSGMFADSLQSRGPSVRAHRTVTFTAPKIAHILSEDVERVGSLQIAPIGSPDRLLDNPQYFLELIDEPMAAAGLLSRPVNSFKGNYGHLLVLAGSRGKSGAASMTALAALRSGAGLVTAAVPRGIQSEVAARHPEVMTEGLAEDDSGAFSQAAWEYLQENLESKSALAIGPGVSQRLEAAALIRRVLQECRLPVVLDAGGVDALRGHLEVLKDRREPVILTPHPGEFSRLLGLPVTDIGARRIELARSFAREHQVWLVLKGFRSIVADPEGGVRVCPLGNPGMATAGMGDVLTGIIGGLLAGHAARGTARGALHAASTGLYLHSLAGDLAAEELGVDALIAGDVIDFLSEALRSLRGDES